MINKLILISINNSPFKGNNQRNTDWLNYIKLAKVNYYYSLNVSV
jgi:hypothetical protein